MDERGTVRPRLSLAQAWRAVVLGLLITGVSSAAHGSHGYATSPLLLAVTALLVTVACLPLCRNRLRTPRLFAALLMGELVLHAWLAWFDLPSVGSATTTLAPLMHGDHVVATLAPRDFSAMIPAPSMVLAHVLAAVVLGLLIVHADRLAESARSLLTVLLTRLPGLSVVLPRQRTRVTWVFRFAPATRIRVHDVRRRGPPAVALTAA
ncbi:MAG: hypothetical protein ACKOAW_00550 [Actinomycetota bacterium]